MTSSQRSKVIKKMVAKWRPVLFLGEWAIDHVYSPGPPPGSDSYGNSVPAAEISVNYPYKHARITTYDPFWSADKETQDTMLCHELCHCHTQELWDFCMDFANGRYHTPDEVWKSVETLTQRMCIIAKYGNPPRVKR